MWTGGIVLYAIVVAFSWAVAKRRPDHRPIAALLTFGIVSDIAREALRMFVFVPAHERFGAEPFTGWPRVAGHVEEALFLGWVAGVASVAVWVFLKRRPWAVLAA